ncbi:MAG: FAD-dependent oxidoreductase [Acetobacteraceae bacterium]|jgi:UDP-galactopyranose mutase
MITASRILVVGAGFAGATVARCLADKGYQVEVIDRRLHVAGNAYDFVGPYGIRQHAYGPHLFHTSNERVIEFLSRFTTWLPYKHKVKAMLENGRLVTLPVNKETSAIVGFENVLDIFFRPYTRKMWGVELDDLDPEILNRVPIREDLNEYYFPNDSFQGLPANGYTILIENMLDHPRINVSLNCSFHQGMDKNFVHTFNSMSIDEYFDYNLGVLPYRSIKFETHTLPLPKAFPVATVNFTHAEPYTRVTEWKNLPGHGDHPSHTVLTFEVPCDFTENNLERYYPVKDVAHQNRSIYESYRRMIPPNLTFIGRCGVYAYLDMHQAVSASLASADRFFQSDLSFRRK